MKKVWAIVVLVMLSLGATVLVPQSAQASVSRWATIPKILRGNYYNHLTRQKDAPNKFMRYSANALKVAKHRYAEGAYATDTYDYFVYHVKKVKGYPRCYKLVTSDGLHRHGKRYVSYLQVQYYKGHKYIVHAYKLKGGMVFKSGKVPGWPNAFYKVF